MGAGEREEGEEVGEGEEGQEDGLTKDFLTNSSTTPLPSALMYLSQSPGTMCWGS